MTATTGSMHQGLRRAAAVLAALAAGHALSTSPLVGVAEAMLDVDVDVAADLHRLQHHAAGPLADHRHHPDDESGSAFWSDPAHLVTITLVGRGH